jgi:hypothetical protein
VAVAVQPLLTRQQPVQRHQQVVIRAGTDLDDHETGSCVRHEDRQQAIPAAGCVRREPGALAGQVGEPATTAGPDRQLARVYGKMFRIASRSRPMPPPTGADS